MSDDELKKDKLWKLCSEFVRDFEINCPEKIDQDDSVIVGAYTLMEEICKIVGYVDVDE